MQIVVVTDDESGATEAGASLVEEGLAFQVIEVPERRLVSASRNLGAQAARGRYLLFVDDDNEFERETLIHLVRALDSPDIVLVGPAMYFGDRPTDLWCAGLHRSPVLARTKWVTRLPEMTENFIPTDDLPNCFMMRREDFEAIGGFDEILFPQVFEEADLAARLRSLTGGRIVCVPRSRTWHHMNAALPHRRYHLKTSTDAFGYSLRRRIFISRHGTSLQRSADKLGARFLFAPPYLWALRSAPKGERLSLAKAYLRGLLVSVERNRTG